jgi:hypothetical protein
MTTERAVTREPATPATPPTPAAPRSRERAGWWAVGAVTAAVAATWAPLLTARYGDNHFGRIQGRYALQIRNLQQEGLLGSSFAADWSPYSDNPYAHHPPLPNLLGTLFGLFPGDGEWQIRLGPYLFALLAIPAAALLLRGLGLGWAPVLLSVGTMAVTGYYWIYSPIMFDLGIILALAAVVAQLRRLSDPPRWLIVAGCAAGLLAGLASWRGIAFAAGLGLWLVLKRRLDRVTVAVAASMVVGVGLSLGYMFGIHGTAALADQTELRTAGGGFTAGEFARRIWQWLTDLLPAWYLALLPLAILAGLIDRRTRFCTALFTVFAAGWVVVLNNGSYVHDYWSYLILVPGVVGFGALFDWLANHLPAKVAVAGAVLAGLGLFATFVPMAFGPTSQQYLYRPVDAGELVAAHPPPATQEYAWHADLSVPRWLAYYWDLHPVEMTAERLVEQAHPTDLVVARLSRLPDWLPTGVRPVAQEGQYALFRVADIRAAMGAPAGG